MYEYYPDLKKRINSLNTLFSRGYVLCLKKNKFNIIQKGYFGVRNGLF